MFSWLGTDDRRKKEPEVFQTVSDGLKKLYKTKLLPLEESYKFHEFHSPALEDADFDNKPMVLLVGQYSTGKTSFIRWEKTAHIWRASYRKGSHAQTYEAEANQKDRKGEADTPKQTSPSLSFSSEAVCHGRAINKNTIGMNTQCNRRENNQKRARKE